MSQVTTSTTIEMTTLVDLLRWRAQEKPDNLAYTFLRYGDTGNECATYQDLDTKVRAISVLLRKHAGEGKRVLLLYPSGVDYMAAYFGCLYTKAVAIPAYPPHSQRALPRIQAIVADANAAIVLTTTSVLQKVQQWIGDTMDLSNLTWLTTDDVDLAGAEQWVAPAIEGDDLAFLQYTSGSTSTPKGVMVSHANLLHNLAMIHDHWHLTEDDIGLSWLPIFHDMGLIAGMLLPLFGGFPSVFMTPTDFLQRPLRWLQAISDYKATYSCAPNFAYELCLRRIAAKDLSTFDLSHWRIASNGAEPIRAETLYRFAQTFAPCGFRAQAFNAAYGLAENTLMVVCSPLELAPLVKSVSKAALKENRVVPVQGAIDDIYHLVGCGAIPAHMGVDIAIVNPETFARCATEEVGEIWISGPSVAQGYWQHPVETAETFQAYTNTGEGPFLRTGDFGVYQDHNLFMTGRLKDLIILGGRNYYPQDIELTVELSHAALRPGCIAAFSIEENQEEQLVVVAEVDHHYTFATGAGEAPVPNGRLEIVKNIRRDIADYHELTVNKVVLLRANSIPKTSSGKLQRRVCRSAFLQGELTLWKG